MKIQSVLLSIAIASIGFPDVALAQDGCDCAAQVEEAKGEVASLVTQLDAVKADLGEQKNNAASADKQVHEKQNQLEALQRELEEVKQKLSTALGDADSAKKQVEGAKREVEGAKKAAADSISASEGKIKTLESDVLKANAKAEELSNARFMLNVDLIKSDVKGVLKKYGLVKDEEL